MQTDPTRFTVFARSRPGALIVLGAVLGSVLLGGMIAARPAMARHRPAHHPAHQAAHHHDGGPRSIGKFGQWQAATHQEGGQTACYAFTYASHSSPPLHGRGRVVLTVTERPGGRDAVAISVGYTYPKGADVSMDVGGKTLAFYTAQRSAFARDGQAAVAAFKGGSEATAKGPAPRKGSISDRFSLIGFSAAYDAINKECPK